eukprot:NODE_5504_length_576_cov_289.953935.p4 GENE.NODE_5504_length_576_cov_289.953935~~NODE_5504_length_576_cov_289.953935.p4  ORF type:complete len:71 (-),score=40.51 NODE_5504_length_576_cov_289.953935:45-257(-)
MFIIKQASGHTVATEMLEKTGCRRAEGTSHTRSLQLDRRHATRSAIPLRQGSVRTQKKKKKKKKKKKQQK